MHVIRSWRWSALAVAFGLTTPVGRAGMITPDSIPSPPSAVASAQRTPVYPSNVVTSQYKSLGLNFSSGAAITNLYGTSVWAPTEGLARPGSSVAGVPPGNYPAAQINYSSTLSGRIVSPGSLNPTTVSSLAVEIVGNGSFPPPLLSMQVYGENGQILHITPLIGSIAGTQNWTFAGPGISSFSAEVLVPSPGHAHPATTANPAWGVAGVSFTPASAPEPSSLVVRFASSSLYAAKGCPV
jgi:hypothetical protein